MAELQRRYRRIIGLALLVSMAILMIMAILIGTGVIGIAEEVRLTVVVAMGLAAAVEGMLAFRYLVTASQ
ncbi:MAG: hypothetical protein ACT4QD_16150 [Acidobacteriota bacterium]